MNGPLGAHKDSGSAHCPRPQRLSIISMNDILPRSLLIATLPSLQSVPIPMQHGLLPREGQVSVREGTILQSEPNTIKGRKQKLCRFFLLLFQ